MKTALGPYAIVSELGRGGMGVVYKAYEPALRRYVAIKALSPALAHQPALVERFLREARAMAAVSDPHVLPIYRIDEDAEGPWFAMEWVDGESLAQVGARLGRIPEAQALDLLRQAAQGLAAAHGRGLVHRDIKPANLLLGSNGALKIADFGIARAAGEGTTRLTGTGDIIGTPGYLSPEACLGQPIDARTDLFALGIVLYELLSGRLPFEADSPFQTMQQVVQAPAPDLATLGVAVHPATRDLLDALLAKSPDARLANATALLGRLEEHPLLRGPRVPLRATPAPVSAETVVSPVPGRGVDPVMHPSVAPSPDAADRASRATAQAPAIAITAAVIALLAGGIWWATHGPSTSTAPDVSSIATIDNPPAVAAPATAAPAVVEPDISAADMAATDAPRAPVAARAVAPADAPAQTPPAREPGPVARYGEAFTGPGVVEVALADIPGEDAAYLRITGIDHPWDGQVIRVQHRVGPRDGRDYFLQRGDSEYVMLVKRRGFPSRLMQYWLYVPELGDIGELTKAPDAARALDTASLRDGWPGRNPD